ncbi:MAG: recombinase family protein [Coprobacillaceae bacterium]
MRYAGYVRVSQESDLDSIEQQKEEINNYLINTGKSSIGTIDWYIDIGCSAKAIEGPEIKKLVAQIELGEVVEIVVTNFNRIVRYNYSEESFLIVIDFLKLLGEHKVLLTCISDKNENNTFELENVGSSLEDYFGYMVKGGNNNNKDN